MGIEIFAFLDKQSSIIIFRCHLDFPNFVISHLVYALYERNHKHYTTIHVTHTTSNVYNTIAVERSYTIEEKTSLGEETYKKDQSLGYCSNRPSVACFRS